MASREKNAKGAARKSNRLPSAGDVRKMKRKLARSADGASGGDDSGSNERVAALRKRARQAEKKSRSLRAEVKELRSELEQTKKARRGAARAGKRADREREELADALQKASVRRGMPAPATPVFFLIGRAKSGTSWLMRLLDAHPEVLCRGEGRIFGREYLRPEILKMNSKTLQPSSLYRAILDSVYLRAWVARSVWTRDAPTDRKLAEFTRVIANYVLATGVAGAGKRIVGDKTPFIGEDTIQEIADVYPEAQVIHIVRDGRDIAVSAMHHLWERKIDLAGGEDLRPEEKEMRDAYRADPKRYLASGKSIFTPERLERTARDWGAQVTKAMADGPRLLDQSYAEVRYEDLHANPESELARLLSFLGADSRASTVARCVRDETFERRTKGRAPGEEDSSHLLRMGLVGDWKRVFNEQDKQTFKEAAGEVLVQLGYEADANW
jgi:hypothetical protein